MERKRREEENDEKQTMNKRKEDGCRNDRKKKVVSEADTHILIFHEERLKWSMMGKPSPGDGCLRLEEGKGRM